MGQVSKKVKELRLRWYGHVKRREHAYVGRRILEIELPGKRKVGRPKRRFMDTVKEGEEKIGEGKSAVATPSRIGSSRKKKRKKRQSI